MRSQLGYMSKTALRHAESTFGRRPTASIAVQRRCVSISTTPSGALPSLETLPTNQTSSNHEGPDAKFEVLGAPFSLLSASLAPSQALYTRRGTLVGLSGKAENAVSSLSTLGPLRRAFLGIPFFYQKVTSTSPITALISTRSPLTSFTVVHLDGTIDWMVAQRNALLAWTGQTLSISPKTNTQLSIAQWGSSQVTGRGLLALVGKGQIYQITLGDGEEYVAHPGNIVAYSVTQHAPQPYRFKSSNLRFEVPGLSSVARIMPETKFFTNMRETATWKGFSNFLLALRRWSRRTIFGDRLFLKFQGPTTILLQTRGSQIGDSLTSREINEIADVPAGSISAAVSADTKAYNATTKRAALPAQSSTLSYANVGATGQVSFDNPKDGSKQA